MRTTHLAQSFLYPILHAKYTYSTRSFEMLIDSKISRNFIRSSSNNISCTCSVISGVVALFGHSSHGQISKLVRPLLNSAAHFLIVETEGKMFS
jgi:hypothetical protein